MPDCCKQCGVVLPIGSRVIVIDDGGSRPAIFCSPICRKNFFENKKTLGFSLANAKPMGGYPSTRDFKDIVSNEDTQVKDLSNVIFRIVHKDEVIAELREDGRLVLNGKYTANDAAKEFWQSVVNRIICPHCHWPLHEQAKKEAGGIKTLPRCHICEQLVVQWQEHKMIEKEGTPKLVHKVCWDNAQIFTKG